MGSVFYSPKQVGELLNLTTKTIYGFLRSGMLGYSKLGSGRGSRIRVSAADIDQLMTDLRRKPFAQKENR